MTKRTLKNSGVRVTSFLDYREFLLALYRQIKTEHKPYSYYHFSEDLGLSHSNVSWLILSGRRKITRAASTKVIEALELTGIDRRYFLALVAHGNATKPQDREKYFQEILALKNELLTPGRMQESLEYFSEWFHPVIREMTRMKNFSSDEKWVISRLINRLMPRHVRESLQLLEKLGLIAYHPDTKTFHFSGEHVTPERSVGKWAGIRYHQKMLEMAAHALTSTPKHRRDVNAVTICISDHQLPRILEIVHKACADILEIEKQVDDPDQVYQVNIQVFPFTKQE